MMVCKVIGHVWATKKAETLEGLRFLMVRPLVGTPDATETELEGAGVGLGAEIIVAADPIGAGPGEFVLVAFGKAARNTIGRGDEISYQTAVIGIVDQLEVAGKELLEAS